MTAVDCAWWDYNWQGLDGTPGPGIIVDSELVWLNSPTSSTSITTSSISPTQDAMVIAWCWQEWKSGSSAPLVDTVPTLSGCGLTWELVTVLAVAGVSNKGVVVFAAVADSPSAGGVTMTFADADTYDAQILVTQHTNVCAGATSALDRIRQRRYDATADNGSAWPFYAAAPARANHRMVVGALHGRTGETATVSSPWTFVSTTNGTTPGARPGSGGVNYSWVIAAATPGELDGVVNPTVTWSLDGSNEGVIFELCQEDKQGTGWAPTFLATAGDGATADATVTVPYVLSQGVHTDYENVGMLLLTESRDDNPVDTGSLVADGWAVVSGSPSSDGAGGAGSEVAALWKLATSDEMAETFTVPDPGSHVIARLLVFEGCSDAGMINASATSAKGVASTSTSITGVTTTVDNALVLYVAGAPMQTSWSGEANASLAYLEELIDVASTAGDDGTTGVWSGVKRRAGASGTLTATVAGSFTEAYFTIALQPDDS